MPAGAVHKRLRYFLPIMNPLLKVALSCSQFILSCDRLRYADLFLALFPSVPFLRD